MIKRTKQQRLEQQKLDTTLALTNVGVKNNDGCLKILNNQLVAMPDKKLTYQSKTYLLKQKRFDTYANG